MFDHLLSPCWHFTGVLCCNSPHPLLFPPHLGDQMAYRRSRVTTIGQFKNRNNCPTLMYLHFSDLHLMFARQSQYVAPAKDQSDCLYSISLSRIMRHPSYYNSITVFQSHGSFVSYASDNLGYKWTSFNFPADEPFKA